ncbi:hypothetical protein B0J17DRAFT_430642 [Rhizoctonia solani]|nr:hypothetical protein B0J17DRAFT_430642 [Rhizoctonia solani]
MFILFLFCGYSIVCWYSTSAQYIEANLLSPGWKLRPLTCPESRAHFACNRLLSRGNLQYSLHATQAPKLLTGLAGHLRLSGPHTTSSNFSGLPSSRRRSCSYDQIEPRSSPFASSPQALGLAFDTGTAISVYLHLLKTWAPFLARAPTDHSRTSEQFFHRQAISDPRLGWAMKLTSQGDTVQPSVHAVINPETSAISFVVAHAYQSRLNTAYQTNIS